MLPSYAKSCHPVQWRVLGRTLKPLCHGHLLLLEAIESPFVVGGPVTLAALLSAVWICSYEHASDAHGSKSWAFTWWILYVRARSKASKTFAAEKLAIFEAYMNAAYAEAPKANADKKATRTSTSPLALHRTHELMRLGYTESEALNMPIAKADWRCKGALEAEGVLVFTTADDIDDEASAKEAYLAWKAEQEAA